MVKLRRVSVVVWQYYRIVASSFAANNARENGINSKITSASNRAKELWLPILILWSALLATIDCNLSSFLMLCAFLCPGDDCCCCFWLARWVYHSRIKNVIIHRFASLGNTVHFQYFMVNQLPQCWLDAAVQVQDVGWIQRTSFLLRLISVYLGESRREAKQNN